MSNAQNNTQNNQVIIKLFAELGKSMQAEAKRFNEEHQKTKERIESGTRITKHRIAL
ncbi:hypothetical protein [Moraxella catarrhalis]|uniref:hypothetical protein n=1 Tax=Moraxella catarrhalis TaxID=480 RepID=UPI000DFCB44A|nr:hypothetical protein [Moraxella catarrhalis]STY79416.1 Uncharacterised protein [Moraxella catarrhalis]